MTKQLRKLLGNSIQPNSDVSFVGMLSFLVGSEAIRVFDELNCFNTKKYFGFAVFPFLK
jgi:hypothetical protein